MNVVIISDSSLQVVFASTASTGLSEGSLRLMSVQSEHNALGEGNGALDNMKVYISEHYRSVPSHSADLLMHETGRSMYDDLLQLFTSLGATLAKKPGPQ